MAANPNDNQGEDGNLKDLGFEDLEISGERDEREITELEDKTQGLVEIANNTFRELCKTLESEQTKLKELEARRLKLQQEVDVLKQEVEQEKILYNMTLAEFADNCNENADVVFDNNADYAGAIYADPVDASDPIQNEIDSPQGLQIVEISEDEDSDSLTTPTQSTHPNDAMKKD